MFSFSFADASPRGIAAPDCSFAGTVTGAAANSLLICSNATTFRVAHDSAIQEHSSSSF